MKRLTALLLALCLMAGLSACTGSGKQENTAADPSGMTINILWQEEDTYRFWELPLQKFAEKYPDVEVKLETNAEAYSAIRNLLNIGEAPDIFYSWISDVDYYGFANEGLLYPVDDVLAQQNYEETGTLGDTVFQAGVSLGELNGKHYFLPITKLVASAFYDQALFAENGWTMAENWGTFSALCDQIAAAGVTPLVYAGAYPFMTADALLMPMVYNLDPAAYDAINANTEGAWKSDAVRTAVGRFAGMVADGYVNPGSLSMDHIQSQIDFISHKDAFVSSGSWLESEMGDQWPDGFELTPLFAPAEDGMDKTSTTAVVECMILPKQADDAKMEYVKELLRMFYSEENAKYVSEQTGYLMALDKTSDEVLVNLPGSVQTIWNKIDAEKVEVISAPYKVKYKEVLNELNNCINALVQSEIDVDGFCERMDTVAQGVN